jgi:hypothetical protein
MIPGVATPWLKRMGWSGWRSELGTLALVLGAFGQCASCLIFVVAGGLPYQDATPELLAKQAKELRSDRISGLAGTTLSIALIVVGLMLIVAARRRNRHAGRVDPEGGGS